MTVQLGHPDAMIAVVGGSSEVNSHFSAPPYQTTANSRLPGVHLVLDSSDVFGGPASNAVVFGTQEVLRRESEDHRRVHGGLEEANQLIAHDPAAAAKIYLDATKEKYTVDEIVDDGQGAQRRVFDDAERDDGFRRFHVQDGLDQDQAGELEGVLFPCRPQFAGNLSGN